MSSYQAPAWARAIYDFVAYMTEEFGGGPKWLKISWVINFHKIITLFIIAVMMIYLDAYSTTAWVYLGLHGVYGYCWLVKDFGFRDSSFETRVTYGGATMAYLLLVGWYWLFPWFFLTREIPPSNAVLLGAIAMHTWGISWMIAGDCQKHFQLKYHRGLITTGMFRYCRNPNFFGEILIYLAYAILADSPVSWIVFAYAVSYFYVRMLIKDESISRYPQWEAYQAVSSRVIPWRLLFPEFRNS